VYGYRAQIELFYRVKDRHIVLRAALAAKRHNIRLANETGPFAVRRNVECLAPFTLMLKAYCLPDQPRFVLTCGVSRIGSQPTDTCMCTSYSLLLVLGPDLGSVQSTLVHSFSQLLSTSCATPKRANRYCWLNFAVD
jgi:hypothetical protein